MCSSPFSLPLWLRVLLRRRTKKNFFFTFFNLSNGAFRNGFGAVWCESANFFDHRLACRGWLLLRMRRCRRRRTPTPGFFVSRFMHGVSLIAAISWVRMKHEFFLHYSTPREDGRGKGGRGKSNECVGLPFLATKQNNKNGVSLP